MKPGIIAIFMLALSAPAYAQDSSSMVKKRDDGACFEPGTSQYSTVIAQSTYSSLTECIGSGGWRGEFRTDSITQPVPADTQNQEQIPEGEGSTDPVETGFSDILSIIQSGQDGVVLFDQGSAPTATATQPTAPEVERTPPKGITLHPLPDNYQGYALFKDPKIYIGRSLRD